MKINKIVFVFLLLFFAIKISGQDDWGVQKKGKTVMVYRKKDSLLKTLLDKKDVIFTNTFADIVASAKLYSDLLCVCTKKNISYIFDVNKKELILCKTIEHEVVNIKMFPELLCIQTQNGLSHIFYRGFGKIILCKTFESEVTYAKYFDGFLGIGTAGREFYLFNGDFELLYRRFKKRTVINAAYSKGILILGLEGSAFSYLYDIRRKKGIFLNNYFRLPHGTRVYHYRNDVCKEWWKWPKVVRRQYDQGLLFVLFEDGKFLICDMLKPRKWVDYSGVRDFKWNGYVLQLFYKKDSFQLKQLDDWLNGGYVSEILSDNYSSSDIVQKLENEDGFFLQVKYGKVYCVFKDGDSRLKSYICEGEYLWRRYPITSVKRKDNYVVVHDKRDMCHIFDKTDCEVHFFPLFQDAGTEVVYSQMFYDVEIKGKVYDKVRAIGLSNNKFGLFYNNDEGSPCLVRCIIFASNVYNSALGKGCCCISVQNNLCYMFRWRNKGHMLGCDTVENMHFEEGFLKIFEEDDELPYVFDVNNNFKQCLELYSNKKKCQKKEMQFRGREAKRDWLERIDFLCEMCEDDEVEWLEKKKIAFQKKVKLYAPLLLIS